MRSDFYNNNFGSPAERRSKLYYTYATEDYRAIAFTRYTSFRRTVVMQFDSTTSKLYHCYVLVIVILLQYVLLSSYNSFSINTEITRRG